MEINTSEEFLDICCYEMMDWILSVGLSRDWANCPFCTEPITYVVE